MRVRSFECVCICVYAPCVCVYVTMRVRVCAGVCSIVRACVRVRVWVYARARCVRVCVLKRGACVCACVRAWVVRGCMLERGACACVLKRGLCVGGWPSVSIPSTGLRGLSDDALAHATSLPRKAWASLYILSASCFRPRRFVSRPSGLTFDYGASSADLRDLIGFCLAVRRGDHRPIFQSCVGARLSSVAARWG